MVRTCHSRDIAPLSHYGLIGQEGKGHRFKHLTLPSQGFKSDDRNWSKDRREMAHNGTVTDTTSAHHHFIDLCTDPASRGPHCLGRPQTASRQQIFDREVALLLNRDQLLDEVGTECFPSG